MKNSTKNPLPSIITNLKRKKRIQDFLDKHHAVATKYWEIVESELSNGKTKKAMRELMVKDPDFYDSYGVVADIEQDSGHEDFAKNIVQEGYERVVMRIADCRGDWPMRMEWGWLENRHIMRMIERQAMFLWEDGKREGSLDIFRRLLAMNPNDNQGARFCILALRMNLGLDWAEPFIIKDGPMADQGLCDARSMDEWFDTHEVKFSEEFVAMKKFWKEQSES